MLFCFFLEACHDIPSTTPTGKNSEKEGRFGDKQGGNNSKTDAEGEQWIEAIFFCEHRCVSFCW